MTITAEARALPIEGAIEFTAPVHRDDRGLFTTPFRETVFRDTLGHGLFPVRDVSHNLSARDVLRGIHYTTTPPGRGKYVYVPHGRVTDFLVDLRVGSPTFGHWAHTELGDDTGRAIFIPVGVGHAFLSQVDASIVVYLMSEEYDPANELAVSPLDPELGLPISQPVSQSERDRTAPTLAQARERGLLPEYAVCREVEARLWR
ncbi:dTDP-4-dehydrorhamnose 3,5-epimerase [Nocardia sp. CDC159]|uniref:dTDP-4-dehydrorhamnose 3,5-epimerase n=1 Tax=Nocardia pulmonis TaxID=2951408 RepID=A0A9X2EDB1_9NOCA|nr:MULTISPECIES: dTDP-4-dehydrorhamnose 3,5-epimerase [Nocardia]MCM6778697.1 dTDP-4-dehydrorhamnose 3,5-epimerase [Nocardia pulmonis]MCM6791586.1 dTDP-4-dehydrorhamnose 3,5-epimerase [Nocardia sp. CDC159]